MAQPSILGNKKYLLLLGDIAILYFTLFITLIIRYDDKYYSDLWTQHLIPFTVVFVIFLTIFYIDELYEPTLSLSNVNLIITIIKNTTIGLIIAFGFFYLGQDRLFTIKPQRVLLINAGLFAMLTYLWHLSFVRFAKSAKIANNLMIIGSGELVQEIAEMIKQKPQLGLKIKIILDDQADFNNLKQICLENKINTIVSTIHPRDNTILAKNLFACLPLKINFYDMANFYEKVTGKVPINTIEQVWFLENLSENNKNLYELTKRIFDIVFSIILLIITLPVVPLIALAIKLNSQGPILFIQTRTGLQGRTFKALKFRSMIINAEKDGAQWATKNDPRVTSLGRILRKTRIDEIPQLINVIKGEMSLIGPRPERPELISKLEQAIPFYEERLLVRPGLSGWAQVMGPAYGGSVDETLKKLQYDLYYIKNRSLALDVSISLRTIKTILTRKGQ